MAANPCSQSADSSGCAVTSDVSLAVPWMDSFLSKVRTSNSMQFDKQAMTQVQVSDAKPDALALHYYGALWIAALCLNAAVQAAKITAGTASSDFVSYVTMMQKR